MDILINLLNFLGEPLSLEILQRGFLAALVVSVLCAVVGTYVVLRGMAFLGDALSHSVFPGVVIAYILRSSIMLGGIIAGLLTSLAIAFLVRQGKLREDTAIGVLFAGAFALGIFLLSGVKTYATDLTSFLFGNIFGVTRDDLIFTFGTGIAALLVLYVLRKGMLLVAFDPLYAASLGYRVALYDYILLALLSVTIVVALQTVGNILVVAMLVTPAATARLLSNRIYHIMGLAAVLAVASSTIGFYLSYYMHRGFGASIVLTSTALFMLALLLAPGRGQIWQRFLSNRKTQPAKRQQVVVAAEE